MSAFVQLELDARPRRRARGRVASIAGERSIPMTRFPVRCAIGIEMRPGAGGELDDRTVGLAGEVDVEVDVLGHVRAHAS